MNRNYYACQCLFKGKTDRLATFGKTIYVFKSESDRDDFLQSKDSQEFYKVTQKEAFKIAELNGRKSVPCVYLHSTFNKYVLANIRVCWGNCYQLLKEFKWV